MESLGNASFYVAGNFAPVREEITAFDLPVRGTIPVELQGRYVRNGANLLGDVTPSHHEFMGEGMLHGIRLRDGKAEWYRNRVVRAGTALQALGAVDPGGPTGDADFSANTHVLAFMGRTFATVEGGPNPIKFDYELNTAARSDFGGLLQAGFAAHPKRDAASGDLHVPVYNPQRLGAAMKYLRFAPNGSLTADVDIPLLGPSIVHDIGVTKTYVIALDLPVEFDATRLGEVDFPVFWQEGRPARVGLLPKNGTPEEVRWFELAPCFVYHIMNAYEDNCGRVLVDVCRIRRTALNDVNGSLGDDLATLDRWILDPSANTSRAVEIRMSDRFQEFPRINPRREGMPYRFGYCVELGGASTYGAGIKVDLMTQRSETQRFDGGQSAEMTFVPRLDAVAEDDGWLLSYVYFPQDDRSALYILNAQDFEGEPMAQIDLPQRVPFGFHGDWIPDAVLATPPA